MPTPYRIQLYVMSLLSALFTQSRQNLLHERSNGQRMVWLRNVFDECCVHTSLISGVNVV